MILEDSCTVATQSSIYMKLLFSCDLQHHLNRRWSGFSWRRHWQQPLLAVPGAELELPPLL